MASNKRLISAGASAVVVEPSFEVVTYTGTSAEQSFDIGFEPDIIWMMGRNTSGRNYFVWDEDGTYRYAVPSSNAFSENANGVSTSSTGFTLQSSFGWNYSGITYVAWCWKAGSFANGSSSQATNVRVAANTNSGFSIVKFKSSTSTAQPPPLNYISHGLNATPELVIYKRLDVATGDWGVNIPSIGNNGGLYLNLANASNNGNFAYDFYDQNSTQIAVRSNYAISRDANYLAFVWHSVDGIQKIGTYVGNDNLLGPTITTGFQPKFVMLKNSSSASRNSIDCDWYMFDTVRDTSTLDLKLEANTTTTEDNLSGNGVKILSNGFQIIRSSGDMNRGGDTYVYIAIA